MSVGGVGWPVCVLFLCVCVVCVYRSSGRRLERPIFFLERPVFFFAKWLHILVFALLSGLPAGSKAPPKIYPFIISSVSRTQQPNKERTMVILSRKLKLHMNFSNFSVFFFLQKVTSCIRMLEGTVSRFSLCRASSLCPRPQYSYSPLAREDREQEEGR